MNHTLRAGRIGAVSADFHAARGVADSNVQVSDGHCSSCDLTQQPLRQATLIRAQLLHSLVAAGAGLDRAEDRQNWQAYCCCIARSSDIAAPLRLRWSAVAPGLLRDHSPGPLMRSSSCKLLLAVMAAISCGCLAQDCSQSGASVEVFSLDQSSTQYLSSFFPFNSGPASFVSNLKPSSTFTSDQINFNSSSSASSGEH